MINKYSFTIETSQKYYNRLLEITKEETIGKMWILQAFVRAIVMTGGLFFLVSFFEYEFSLTTLLYVGIVISTYYIFTAYKFSKSLKKEYSIANLSTKPKKITLSMSENNIFIDEDNKKVPITWDDINGFDEKNDGLLIGYLDGEILMIDTNHLEPEKYKSLIDLIKSKLAKDNTNDKLSSIIPIIAASITAVLGIIFLYFVGYIFYNLIIDTPSLIGIIIMSIIGVITLIISMSLFFIARRELKSWKEQKSSNKTQEPI